MPRTAATLHREPGEVGLPFSWKKHLPPVVAFWVLFALLYANVIYLSMMGHGHAWWRLVLWQGVNWLAWAALTPVVVALGRRFPVAPRWRSAPHFALHALLGLALSLVHLVPLAWATSRIEPYSPLVPPRTFAEAYRSSLGSWLRLDVVIYWAILAAWTAGSAFVRARERERRAAELETLLARRELELLRLQLQPHFLFNTLHAAISLIREGSAREASGVLVGLSDLLRRVIDPELGQEVALEVELRFLDRYLDIQRVRYPELRVDLEIEPAARAAAVPSLALQPLVENAIDHGVARAGGGRWVRISARRRGDRLVVEIENPAAADDEAPARGAGIGLTNTRRRLRELYAGTASLTLGRRDDGVMEARLELPWRPADEAAA